MGASRGSALATGRPVILLLFLNFRRLTETLIMMLSLPFALVGVAVETGGVMPIYFDQALAERQEVATRAARAFTYADLDAAIMVGTVESVRLKMMIAVAITAGLMPVL